MAHFTWQNGHSVRIWPPVSRFGAFQPTKQGVYCLKVCNALARVLGAFSARSGFGLFLHPAACFGILLRPSRCTRSDKPPRWRENGATGPSFSPPAHLPVAVAAYPSFGPRLRSGSGAGSRPRFWRARRSRTSALLPISAIRASLSPPDVER